MHCKKLFIVFVFGGSLLFGQERKTAEDDQLNMQQVEVTKSYTPSVSEVVKLRTAAPSLDTLTIAPKRVQYNFLSIPVLSTFVPNKATPLQLERPMAQPQYNSQFKMLLGNNKQMQLDASANLALDRQQYLGIDLVWNQKGNLPNTTLNSEQTQFLINFNHDYYTNRLHAVNQIRFEGTRNQYYGVYEQQNLLDIFSSEGLDPLVKRGYFDAVSHWEWYDNPVQKLKLNLSLTTDNFSSSEQLISVETTFRLSLRRSFIDFTPQLEVVQTDFIRDYYTDEAISTQQIFLGTGLQYIQLNRDFKYKIGAKAFWVPKPWEPDGVQLFYYPDILLSYNSKKSVVQPYLTVSGGLHANTYTSLSLQNPFIAPSANLRPQEERYKVALGLNTQFNLGIDFGLEGFYANSAGVPLFRRLAYSNSTPRVPYAFANAYEVIFDTQTRYGAKLSMQYEMDESNQIGFNIQHNTYEQTTALRPWNLPQLEFEMNGNFSFLRRFLLMAKVHYWGNREVAYRPIFLNQPPELNTPEVRSMSGLTAINMTLNYQTKTPWSFFVKGDLNLGSAPQYWLNYPLFPSLVAAGFRYNFNFSM